VGVEEDVCVEGVERGRVEGSGERVAVERADRVDGGGRRRRARRGRGGL
jgi:hypothetical protein